MYKPRRQIGNRRYRAAIEQHDATQDAHGQPTLPASNDWDVIVSAWPCEMLTTSGQEVIRGRQVTATTTHVFYGEYFGVEGVTTDMRMIVEGQTFAIIAAFDPLGDRREMRVEAKRES